MMENIVKIAEGLSEMETPLLEARHLAMAVRLMAGSSDLPKDAGSALDTVADLLFIKLIALNEQRTKLYKLARTPGLTLRGAGRGGEMRLTGLLFTLIVMAVPASVRALAA
jgi:hypothetical protein